MKVYLAGPMRGKPDLNFPAFNAAAAKLRAEGHFVFNPAENAPADGNIRQCMAIDTAWICAFADAMAMLPDWTQSRGARAEHALAHCLGLDVIYLYETPVIFSENARVAALGE